MSVSAYVMFGLFFLSGAAALGIAAFVFLALFFATGLIVNRIVRGV